MMKIKTPLTADDIKGMKAGTYVLISGDVYTARDAAHKRFAELLKEDKTLPVELKDQVIYYASPTPERPGKTIGSIGPTTSKRMDPYTGELLKQGLKGMIGKGPRTEGIIEEIKKQKAVYLVATGGAGAFLSQFVKEKELIAFEDLGPEAVYRLRLEDFPALVAIDCFGNNIFPFEVDS